MQTRLAFKFIILLLLTLPIGLYASTEKTINVKLYFGLSLPKGNSVSLFDWRRFETEEIAKKFEGFNIIDSTGYYKGKPERSKVVTIVMSRNELGKAKDLAALYAKTFDQESVMIVVSPVEQWLFVKPEQGK